MGVFGFHCFKDKFSRDYEGIPKNSIIAFDITHIVVQCLHDSTNKSTFIKLFQVRFNNCLEMNFIRSNYPKYIFLTLDNRSPKSKRQTQQKRLLNNLPLVERIRTSGNVVVPKIKIRDVWDILRDYLLNDVFTSEKFSKTIVNFDVNSGEGEMKAINFLKEFVNTSDAKIIMSRDNDVFVYLLGLHDKIDLQNFLIFYEQNKISRLLRCWTDIPKGYSWILVLWLGICYGNDYTYGFFEKNTNVLSGKFVDILNYFKFCIRNDMISYYDEKNSFFLRDNIFLGFKLLITFLRNNNNYYKPETTRTTLKNARVSEKTLLNWLRRQIWSFAYAIEMPTNFLQSETFGVFPTIKINTNIEKPFIPLNEIIRFSDSELENVIIDIIDLGF